MEKLINATLAVCREADNYHSQRTRNSIFNHMMSEIGELGIEINIMEGQSYKQPGPDGIVGEAIDVMLSAIDFIYVGKPEIEAEDMDLQLHLSTPHASYDCNSLFTHLCMCSGFMAQALNDEHFDSGHEVTTGNNGAVVVVRNTYALIKYMQPGITDDELLAIAQPKLYKWIQSIKKHYQVNASTANPPQTYMGFSVGEMVRLTLTGEHKIDGIIVQIFPGMDKAFKVRTGPNKGGLFHASELERIDKS